MISSTMKNHKGIWFLDDKTETKENRQSNEKRKRICDVKTKNWMMKKEKTPTTMKRNADTGKDPTTRHGDATGTRINTTFATCNNATYVQCVTQVNTAFLTPMTPFNTAFIASVTPFNTAFITILTILTPINTSFITPMTPVNNAFIASVTPFNTAFVTILTPVNTAFLTPITPVNTAFITSVTPVNNAFVTILTHLNTAFITFVTIFLALNTLSLTCFNPAFFILTHAFSLHSHSIQSFRIRPLDTSFSLHLHPSPFCFPTRFIPT